MADGQVVFEITADGRQAIASVRDITNAIDRETRNWDRATQQSTASMESSFMGTVKKIAAGIGAVQIGKAILNWGKAAIDAASDLAEVQNVVDVTFGDGAKQIDSWAKTAGTQFGLTETQAKKFTSTLGAMMKSAGMSGNEIIGMSTDLAGLAADMASFYNLDFETAFQKIRSGISGETEPLRQLGINMSVANLEAFALEKGITKAFNSMSQQEQTMLRYQYLMQATADAQGDFARTSDSFANASRRVEAALDTISTKGGQLLLSVIDPLTSGLADFLTKITTPPESTIFDDFNEIDLDTAGKMADLEQTYNKAQDIINLLEEISEQTLTLKDGSTVTFEELFKDIGNVEKNGGDVRGYLEGLGVDVDLVIQKYQVWKESTRQLTSLVPSLTAAIDSETGAINGGTGALQKNLDEWKAYQEKKIAWAAYYAKEQALAEKKGSMYLDEFDAGAARQAAKRLREQMQETYGAEFDENGAISYNTAVAMSDSGPDSQWFKDVAAYNKLLTDQWEKEKTLSDQTGDLAEAEQQLADGKAALIEKYGEEEEAAKNAGEAAGDFGGKSAAAWKETTSAVYESVKALTDYVKSVHDATEQAVNSVVKGFDKITRPTTELEKKRSDLIEQQNALNRSTEEGEKRYQELQNQIDELNKSMDQYSPKEMQDGLKSQIAFMEEYIQNLEKAREMTDEDGNRIISDELLASLSDGSVASAEYLSQLVANPTQAGDVNKLFQQVQETKKGFTDALTQQKLTVDETYDAMVAKAREAVSEMNQGDAAAAAMGSTVSGLAAGISSHVSEVSAAVNSIIAELDRLNGYGVSIDLGSFGSINFGAAIDGAFETGLDYVPFNGFLAELHEGEGILTAEENRVWQRFKNGGIASRNVDYDALGATMRDNVKPGGDVYLDGRVVGSVISAQQGKSYRQLQRSGWQS